MSQSAAEPDKVGSNPCRFTLFMTKAATAQATNQPTMPSMPDVHAMVLQEIAQIAFKRINRLRADEIASWCNPFTVILSADLHKSLCSHMISLVSECA